MGNSDSIQDNSDSALKESNISGENQRGNAEVLNTSTKNLNKNNTELNRNQGDAVANARIANLKRQLWSGVDNIRKKYDDAELEFRTIEDIESDIKDIQRNFQYRTLTDPIYKRDELYEIYSKIKQKKAQLVRRLSETAGEQVKRGNPELADLGSENRATRLFAKFSELYDNEFTDLFEVYSAKLPHDFEEKIVTCHVRDILQYCYSKCKMNSEEQRGRLICMLHKDNNVDPDTSAVGLQLRIKEFQMKVAKFTIPNLQFNVLHGIFTEDLLVDLLKTISPRVSGTNPYLRTYLDRCTELCWYIQTQDPPVVLDFNPRRNFSDYRPYTKLGPYLDYVVWPVLQLHENGPILYKGIARFKGDDSVPGVQNDTRLLSGRKRKPHPRKREPKPYDFIPSLDTSKLVRAEITESNSPE